MHACGGRAVSQGNVLNQSSTSGQCSRAAEEKAVSNPDDYGSCSPQRAARIIPPAARSFDINRPSEKLQQTEPKISGI